MCCFLGSMFFLICFFFFFNDTATTEIYTLSLHDALPIWSPVDRERRDGRGAVAAGHWRDRESRCRARTDRRAPGTPDRSEEHTSELQSQSNLVCRLLLEKKKNKDHKFPGVQHARS